MATWKKVIVSGSNAELNQITASGGITATLSLADQSNFVAYNSSTGQFSYYGTGSFTATSASFATSASYALSSSYAVSATNALTANTASFVTASNVWGPSGASSVNSSSFALTASYALNVPTTASYAVSASQAISSSFATTVSSIANNVTNNTNNYILTATGGGSVNGESNLTFDGSLLTVAGNATITGDLTVAGTASFINTDNLNIRDKFILINSGSGTLADSGWITQYNAAGSGSAFYLEATSTGTYGRFAVAYDITGTATAVAADEYVVTAKVNQSAPTSQTPTWGGNSTNGQGNMWLTSTGDIYIWA
jgi:hypothetical protein